MKLIYGTGRFKGATGEAKGYDDHQSKTNSRWNRASLQPGRRVDGIGEIGVQKINRKGGAISPAFPHEKEFLEDTDI